MHHRRRVASGGRSPRTSGRRSTDAGHGGTPTSRWLVGRFAVRPGYPGGRAVGTAAVPPLEIERGGVGPAHAPLRRGPLFHRRVWLWLRRGAGGRVARRWLVAVGVGGSGRHGGGDLGCLELAGRAGVGGGLGGWCPNNPLGR